MSIHLLAEPSRLINRSPPSPYFSGSYELFQMIQDNNMRFEGLKQEMSALSSSIAAAIGEMQAKVQHLIVQVESTVGSLQSQMHVVHRTIAQHKDMNKAEIDQLRRRVDEQDKYLAFLGQHVAEIGRMILSRSYASYSYHPTLTSHSYKK